MKEKAPPRNEKTMFARDMLDLAEDMGNKYEKIKITTTDGCVYVGELLTVGSDFNDEGDETPWDCVILDIGCCNSVVFANWEIEKVEAYFALPNDLTEEERAQIEKLIDQKGTTVAIFRNEPAVFLDEETMRAQDKLRLAAIMAKKHKKIKITTTDGRVYVGELLDIGSDFNDDGDETPWDCVHLGIDENTYETFANWEIEKVKKA